MPVRDVPERTGPRKLPSLDGGGLHVVDPVPVLDIASVERGPEFGRSGRALACARVHPRHFDGSP